MAENALSAWLRTAPRGENPFVSLGVAPQAREFGPAAAAAGNALAALVPDYFRQPDFSPPVPGTIGKTPQASRGLTDMLIGGAVEGASFATPAGAAKAAAMPLAAVAARRGIRAFHASPHDFDRFDMSKIGSGEGAQAYGHGLYFAEAKPVAQQYYDTFARDVPLHVKLSAKALDNFGLGDYKDAVEAIRKTPELAKRIASDPSKSNEDRRDAQNILEYVSRPAARMYEVNIDARPEQFLDWDAPIATQPQSALDALRRVVTPSVVDRAMSHPRATGQTAYEIVSMNKAKAAEVLRDAGIPGIRYLDAGSRASGEGSRNYVVFDDSLIDILRKYGITAAFPAGIAASMAAPQDADQ